MGWTLKLFHLFHGMRPQFRKMFDTQLINSITDLFSRADYVILTVVLLLLQKCHH